MKQAVNCDLFLYADDSCLVYQHNDVSIIEQNLNKNFSNICDWFVKTPAGQNFFTVRTYIFTFSQSLQKINHGQKKLF